VVVGGGVIGVSCAYYLALEGARVTLLERDRIGAGASSGNAGTVSAGHPPLNRPGRVREALGRILDPASPLYIAPRWDPALWRWLAGFARYCTEEHVERAMAVLAPLGMDALSLFDRLVHDERIECEYRSEGYHDVCSTEAGLASASREAGVIERYGYHPEVLDGDELRRREPALGGSVVGGVYYPEARTLDPALFLHRLRVSAARHGAVIREGAAVEGVIVRAGRAEGVRLAGGEVVGSDAVVLAMGPFGLNVVGELGTRLPVQPGKGYHRDVEIGPNGAPRLRIACVLHETSIFCTPMDTFVRFAGTMEFTGHDIVLRRARLRQLTRAAKDALPGLGTARPVSQWSGLRPMSVDGLPIVGALPHVEGVAVATGHGMLGLTLGPVTGEMIANLVLRGSDARLTALSPSRFKGRAE
jgi:D-amino-acid dehydrogenase